MLILHPTVRAHPRTRYGEVTGFREKGRVSDEAETGGDGSRLAAVLRPQFADDVGDVKLDRTRTDVELLGNLGVRVALAEKVEHFPLAQRELTAWWRFLYWGLAARRGDG